MRVIQAEDIGGVIILVQVLGITDMLARLVRKAVLT